LSVALLSFFPLTSCSTLPADAPAEETDDQEDDASDDEEPGDEQPADLTVSEFVHEAAVQNCEAFARCMGAGLNAALSGQTCLERRGYALQDTLADLEPLIEEGRVRYDADAARACLPKLAELDCDDLRNATELDCAEGLSGTVALGEGCDRDIECEGSAYCALSAACPGTCTARHARGEACLEENECEGALACVAGSCLAPAGAQEACGAGSPCNLASLCVGAIVSQGVNGTCVRLADSFAAQEGDACDFNAAKYCADGLSCVVSAVGHSGGVVAYCEKPSARDAACSFGFPTPCPDGQYCDADPRAGSYDGTCRALPGTDQACVRVSGAPTCAAGLGCINALGVCKPVGRNGQACSDDAQCRSEHCASGECSAGLGC
jgi:hypothetical protein